VVSGLAIPGAGERALDPVIDEPEVVMGHPKMSGRVGSSTLILTPNWRRVRRRRSA